MNKPLTFKISLHEQDDRLDCAWFNPVVSNKIESLKANRRSDRRLTKLKLVADVNGGKRLPKGTVIGENESDKIPYIRATDVKNLRVNVDNAIRISKDIHKTIQDYQLKKSDIALTIVGTIGQAGILNDKVDVCDFTENVARVRIKNDSLLPNFLLYFLDSELGRIQSERFSVGALQYKLSLQSCRNIEIYLPWAKDKYNIEKQKSILSEVNSIIKQAEDSKQKSDQLIQETKDVAINKIGLTITTSLNKFSIYERILGDNTFSRLDTLFNSPYREKLLNTLKKYPNRSLGLLVKPQENNKIVPSDFYRLVELEQIDEETGRIINFQEVPELGSEKIVLKKGSLLISKLQPEKGKVAIVPDAYDGCVGSSELLPYILNSTEVSLKYLWAIIRSDYVLKQWEYELTGSSRMRIGPNEISHTIIPIPERKIQTQIVAEIEERIQESDKFLEETKQLFIKAKEKFVKLLLVK